MGYRVIIRDRDESPYDRDPNLAVPRRPQQAPNVAPNNVLGVFGLSVRTRERDLEDEFGKFGDVEKVVIVYDQRVSLHISAEVSAHARLIGRGDSDSSPCARSSMLKPPSSI